jgi:hypothetical protein
MAVESYTTQLERVQATIAKIEGGAQSYSVEGNSFTRADLPVLYTRERELRALVARESSGGIRLQRGVPS